MEHENRIDELIARLKAGTITDEELADLTGWYNDFDDTRVTLSTVEGDNTEDLKARMYRRLIEKIKPTKKANRPLLIRSLPYAAAVFLAIIGTWYVAENTPDATTPVQVTAKNVPPGGYRAKLTLADGQTVSLSEAQTGITVGDGITYFDGSSVISEQGSKLANDLPLTRSLSLSTPRGGTYQIALPDGTLVWLNSASVLKYPSRFDGPERVVELEGEAYFDVSEQWLASDNQSSQQRKPFKVISDGQVVEVLGTQFNISAYPDELQTRTTLVTGRVQVAPATTHGTPIAIKPGQQSAVREGNIRVTTVDTTQYIAWKQGIFHFESTPLEGMLKQIARWYDVEVIYNNGIPNETFTGRFKRDVSLKGVVDILRLSLIDIELEDGALIVN